ncbi:ureidoglycolate lyase [Martelella endophytica]|uniref:Ureidoglycolate lyase n=1 Tax=Martelella endophytica TaxID=1486262 RepID=A0A0D5LLV2_MAREN|nr:ureidoglycolate lyase [Martelella endophytica]AJY44752.1 ureidoglycolate hydrolase [Martelella endophytica]
MSIRLAVEPLTPEAFRPFGTVIAPDPSTVRMINGGSTTRFHALAEAEALGPDAKVIISLFRGKPRRFPYQVDMMERHPLGSQSFSPLGHHPFLVVVAEDHGGTPATPRVFRAEGGQGVNYRPNVWHHPLMALGEETDFLVVDRDGPGNNLEEYSYPALFVIEEATP